MLLDITQWAALWGAVLPLLVGLVTKYTTNAGAKAVLLLALNLVAGILAEFFAGPVGFDWRGALVTAAASFVIGVATHYGLWKPTGTSGKLQAIGSGSGAHAAVEE